MTDSLPRFRVVLYAPDRARTYDGRTRDMDGVGGGITARLSLVEALAALGHDVIAYVHCEAPVVHEGVSYVPVDDAKDITCDVLIAISTGGAMTLAPLRQARINARLRILWVQGVPKPVDIEAVGADYVVAASNFLRRVCTTEWRVPAERLFVCYNGIHQEYFRDAERESLHRDPYGIAFVGPPEKGLAACVRVVRELRKTEPRYHLDVFGGAQLWSQPPTTNIDEPGVAFKGMIGQRRLARTLFGYEYLLALQDIAEGFGMAVQEAKRAGAIAIASQVGAFGELIRHGADGYLIAGPAESSATQAAAVDLIRRLGDDPLRRARIRRRALTTPWDWQLAARTWTEHWQAFFDSALTSTASIDLADGRHRLADGAYFPTVYDRSPLPDRLGVPDPQQFLLAGYFGHGNLGDEAILSVELDEWQRARPDVVPVVASGNPAETAAAHDVRAVDERDIAALRREAARSAAVVLGGGGLFHDAHGVDESTVMTSDHSGIPECATFVALAEQAHTPLLIVGAGVGPLTTRAGHGLTRRVFDAAQSATVRDRESAAAIETLGSTTTPVVVADFAFLLPSAPAEAAHRVLRALGLSASDGRIVCVTLRPWDAEASERDAIIAAALDRVIAAHNVSIVFAPFHWTREPTGDDATAADRVRRRMTHSATARVLPAGLSPAVVQAVFAVSDAVLTARLHGVILAANAGTPFVALEHAEKIPATLRQLGLPDEGIDLATLTTDRLTARLAGALEARPRFAAAYARTLPALRAAARRAIEKSGPGVISGPDQEDRKLRPAPIFPPTPGIDSRSRSWPIPRAWRRPLREAWQARFLSRAGLAFDHFIRARRRMTGRDVAGAVAPATPGLVSIVLPVHNGGALLREALDSVLAQHYAVWQLIVVDDGSTDDSAAVARGYAARDPRVQIIQQSWQKLPAALTHGFAHARGEFLTWTSADNRLKPDAIAKLVDCLRRHPRWDVTYANLDLIGDDGLPLRDSPHFRSYQRRAGSAHISLPASTEELNTRDNNFIGAGFLYRRRVATLICDYSSFRFGLEDYDYWMRANALLTVRKADFEDAIVEYRFHGGSLTARAHALGLPAARTRLQIFDGFRRDSALWPLVWVVDPSLSVATALLQRTREAGHVICGAGDVSDVSDAGRRIDRLPTPWVPVVVISDNPRFEPSFASNATLRVIIERDDSNSSPIPSGWDLRVRIGSEMPRDWTDDDRRSLLVPDLSHLFHAIDIRARSSLSAAIESLAEAPPPASLTASIVVCAARDIPTLGDVVLSALRQDWPPDQFEVIVVNNSPGDPALGAALRRLPPQVRIIPCPIPGHSAARNAGLGAARGRYVCYLDDDAIPGEGWLAALCRAFEAHPDAGVIGGPILLEPPSPPPSAFTPGWAQFWSHFAPPFADYREVSDRSAFPWGANWAARRDVLYQIGGFRLAVGRRGQDHRGGEELVAAELAQRLGHRIGIAPDAVVRHRVDPSRFTTAHVRGTQAARHLVAQAVARDDVFEHRGGPARSLIRLLAHHVDPRVRAWPHALQDVGYRKAAQWQALRADLADFRRRFKRRARED